METPSDTNPVDERAARWAARLAHGQITAQSDAELTAWLLADRRHRGALIRAQAALHLLEDAVVRRAPALPQSSNDGQYRRRSWHRMAGWAIAASLLLLAFPAGLPVHGQKIVDLADGSVATLDDNAQILSKIDAHVRTIVLLRGQARFEVARDPSRPFVVHAGHVSAQATGTVYAVDRVGDVGATVRVDEGSVLVWAGDARDQAVLLRAGGKLTLEPGSGDKAPAPDVAQIALNDDPIVDAAARFNRINQVQVVVDDPGIGSVRIVGLFKANDPHAFATAAAAVAGGCAIQNGNRIVIRKSACSVIKN